MDIEYDDLGPGISSDEIKTGWRRIAQIGAGVLLVAAGIVMLVAPGPGLVAIAVGLNLIKPDNAVVKWMRRKVPGLPEEGRVPTSYLLVGAVFLVVGTAIGVLWGEAIANWLLELVGLR